MIHLQPPEHYLRAENFASRALERDIPEDERAMWIGLAQVHATLAQTPQGTARTAGEHAPGMRIDDLMESGKYTEYTGNG